MDQNQRQRSKAIIFDMDNTLLSSKMDFVTMKADICRLLQQGGYTPNPQLSVAAIMHEMESQPGFDAALGAACWRRIDEVERQGMANALLEPGAAWLLSALEPAAYLLLLTNNQQDHAQQVLDRFALGSFFSAVCGREQVKYLKPQPDGYLQLMAQFPALRPGDFLAVGDALIDMQAAHAAGIGFVAYTGSRQEDWQSRHPGPLACVPRWDETALAVLRQLLAR